MNRQIILDFATMAHAGQKRKDGKDYITHPIAVAKIAMDWWDNRKKFLWEPFTGDMLYAVCLLHDTIEDTWVEVNDIWKVLLQAGFDEDEVFTIVHSVLLLTRLGKTETILEYLQPMLSSHLATAVKLFDLEHNMSDLSPGNLLDKYSLCKWYLETRGGRSGEYHD